MTDTLVAAAIEQLRDLIRLDTTSRNSNLALLENIQAQLDGLHIPYELTFNADRSKANLFATIGDGSVPGLVLSGHSDVVPVDGQDWSGDPFCLREHDGRLYGRGSCDMKGFIAVCMAMAASFKSANLPVPIHFAFSYDEEIGCLGVRDLISELDKRAVRPLACVVGEPTMMRVVSAHKGMLDTCCTVHGQAGHSSLPDQGVNAVFVASKLINRINEIGQEIKLNGPFDARFTPPYTTLHVGKVQGGTAVNIIPERCEFEYEIRNIPTQDPQQIAHQLERYAHETLLPEMLDVSEHSEIRWHTEAVFPGLDTPAEQAVNNWMKRILDSEEPLAAVSYGTEAGLFSDIGIQTVVCGPGSIEQAHRANEYVEHSQIEACLRFMQDLIAHIQAGDWLEQS